jgi:hypothetical protein
MKRTIRGISCAAVAAVVLCAGPALASPTLNEGNDFEMGTLQGWATVTGAPQPESVNSGGNPDRFLRVTANGTGGAGGRLVAFNRSNRWTGNYKSANVGAVTIDLKNFGTAPLSMRLAFEETGGTWYAATNAFTVPADNAWHSTRFDLLASNFTPVEGATPFDTGMTRVREFRVLHAADADYKGDVIASSFGMDNLLAVVPEPGTAALAAVAAAGTLLRRARRRAPAAR